MNTIDQIADELVSVFDNSDMSTAQCNRAAFDVACHLHSNSKEQQLEQQLKQVSEQAALYDAQSYAAQCTVKKLRFAIAAQSILTVCYVLITVL